MNFLRVLLVSSVLAFLCLGTSRAMEADKDELTSSNLQISQKNEEDNLSTLQPSKKTTFIETYNESKSLHHRLNTLSKTVYSLMASLMGLSDKSSEAAHQKLKFLLRLCQEKKLIEERMHALPQ